MSVDEFPLRDNSNLDDPEEMFLHLLVGLPGMKGAPLPFPVSYLRQVSRRLYDGGARLVADPIIEYHPPRTGDVNSMFSAGTWKPVGTAKEPPIDVDISRLPDSIRKELVRQLIASGEIPGIDPTVGQDIPDILRGPNAPEKPKSESKSDPKSVPAEDLRIRVREVAKQCGVSNKTALKALKEIGSDVKSVNAAIDRSTAFKLYGLLAQPR